VAYLFIDDPVRSPPV